jgi:hypothetical protein
MRACDHIWAVDNAHLTEKGRLELLCIILNCEGGRKMSTITTKDGVEISYEDGGKRSAHRLKPGLAVVGR